MMSIINTSSSSSDSCSDIGSSHSKFVRSRSSTGSNNCSDSSSNSSNRPPGYHAGTQTIRRKRKLNDCEVKKEQSIACTQAPQTTHPEAAVRRRRTTNSTQNSTLTAPEPCLQQVRAGIYFENVMASRRSFPNLPCPSQGRAFLVRSGSNSCKQHLLQDPARSLSRGSAYRRARATCWTALQCEGSR